MPSDGGSIPPTSTIYPSQDGSERVGKPIKASGPFLYQGAAQTDLAISAPAGRPARLAGRCPYAPNRFALRKANAFSTAMACTWKYRLVAASHNARSTDFSAMKRAWRAEPVLAEAPLTALVGFALLAAMRGSALWVCCGACHVRFMPGLTFWTEVFGQVPKVATAARISPLVGGARKL